MIIAFTDTSGLPTVLDGGAAGPAADRRDKPLLNALCRRQNDDMTALLAQLAAPVGAVMTTLIGVFAGSVVGRRAQDRHWIREQQATACARVLRESSSVLVGLSDMDRDRPADLPQGVLAPTTVDWRPWNEALAIVNLVARQDIAEAAHAIDEEIWRFHITVRRGLTPEENWLDLRGKVVAAQGSFIAVARRHLSITGDPLQRLDGRPGPDDPIWQTGRFQRPG